MSRSVTLLLALLFTPSPAATQERVLSVAVSMKEAGRFCAVVVAAGHLGARAQ